MERKKNKRKDEGSGKVESQTGVKREKKRRTGRTGWKVSERRLEERKKNKKRRWNKKERKEKKRKHMKYRNGSET